MSPRTVSRRGLLRGGAGGVGAVTGGAALVEYDVLPGRSRAYTLLGLKPDVAPVPDVARQREAYADIALRIDIGSCDSFYRAVMDYEEGLPEPPGGGVDWGSHTHAYWRFVAPRRLRFLGEHLGRS